ncbi:FAD-dependent oxidoreductase [Sphingomonas sp.]|uniref:FAD-dependent oxidoreductase n=1 Tax=Sphingomonas sp. TaxID=28214 RepID=UPI001ED7B226|nr:FAD-dependent oxidoreductase [Sphingomonas sp.]MBX3592898.1 FAD-dependent oxidoreductase [Sphingomonas sp.]
MLAMSGAQDIIVIGAGVVGMATALTLADRGHRVTVIDGAEGPGLGTSFANGAQLSYAYTDALASPGVLGELPRLALGRDPAFRLRLHLDPDFLRWGLAFLRNCAIDRFQRNTIAGLALAARARDALEELTQRHALDYAQAMPGKIHLYRSAAALSGAERMAALKARYGVRQEVLDPDATVAHEPALAPIRHDIAGALHTAGEAVGDPHLFCTEAAAALRRLGGTLRFGTRVARIVEDGATPAIILTTGERIGADRVVLAAATGSVALARSLGVRLPIQPVKGYSITAPIGAATPHASITDAANRVVFARLGDRVRIAGLADLGARDTTVDGKRLAALIASARAALPGAADYGRIEMRWAGLRPMTPNSLPITRAIAPGVIANCGHGALGWTWAAGSAREVADLIGGRT